MTEQRLVITQGQQAVSNDRNVVFNTLLGSCVAVCLWDPVAKLGGINHILLASQKTESAERDLEGMNAMELLINAMVKQGGQRDRLVAKVFGGAQMIDGLSDIGAANACFVLNFLAREGFCVVSQSLGGTAARQLLFWPVTGAARLKTVAGQGPRLVRPTKRLSGNGLELF